MQDLSLFKFNSIRLGTNYEFDLNLKRMHNFTTGGAVRDAWTGICGTSYRYIISVVDGRKGDQQQRRKEG